MSPTIQEMREAREKATGGVWAVASDLPAYAVISDVGRPRRVRVVQTPNQNNYGRFDPSERWLGIEHVADASFIALAANNWLPMCDEIETLRADKAALTLRLEAAEKALAKLQQLARDDLGSFEAIRDEARGSPPDLDTIFNLANEAAEEIRAALQETRHEPHERSGYRGYGGRHRRRRQAPR